MRKNKINWWVENNPDRGGPTVRLEIGTIVNLELSKAHAKELRDHLNKALNEIDRISNILEVSA